MEKARLTFNKGMMPDADISARPQGAYEDALNLAATPSASGDIGTLTVAKSCYPELILSTGSIVVGSTVIGNNITVLFVVDTNTNASIIYKFISGEPLERVYTDTNSTSKLNFSIDHPIDAIGRYETEESQKVYWVQDNQPLRVLNLANTYTVTQPSTIFDIIPDAWNVNAIPSNPISGGALLAGRVQYTIKLGVKYGQSSGFGPLSKIVNVFKTPDDGIDGISGDDKDISTGKQITVTTSPSIVINNSIYNQITFYRVHYATKGLPTIHLISEQDLVVGTTVYSCVDNGDNLAELSLEEFNSTGSRFFYAKTIDVKDNILFAANITEPFQTLNIDCRSYRFDSGGSSIIKESNGSYFSIYNASGVYHWTKYTSTGTIISTGVGLNTIPENADCINEYNNEFLVLGKDSYAVVNPNEFVYRGQNTSLTGGEGPVISYTITRTVANQIQRRLIYGHEVQYVPNSNGDTFYHDKESFTHKPGEIYRYGIVWYDKKGKAFPVKWIGDIRIPPTWKTYETYSGATPYTINTPINIKFDINFSAINPNELAKVAKYSIVRVKKEEKDRQIVTSGWTWKCSRVDAGNNFRQRVWTVNDISTFATSDIDYIHPLYSPELFFNGGIDFSGTGYIAKVTGILRIERYARDYKGSININGDSASVMVVPGKEFDSIGDFGGYYISKGMNFTVRDCKKLGITEKGGAAVTLTAATNSSFTFVNRVQNYEQSYHEMYGPTSGVFTTKVKLYKGFPTAGNVNNDIIPTDKPGYYVYSIDIYRDNAKGVFGGNTYQARSLNTYVPASGIDFTQTSGSKAAYSYGDIKTTVFECLSSIHDPNFEEDQDGGTWGWGDEVGRRQVCTAIPIASYVDCSMSKLKPSRLILDADFIPPRKAGIGERTGLQETTVKGISLYGEAYPVDLPDYISYNTAYSETGSYPTYSAEKLNTVNIEKLPFTVIASEKKTNGELSDSWTTFKYANTLDVDTEGGQINALKTTDNKLFFWQDRSTGIISTNDRYVINEGSVGQLALGTGGILERYDYISSKIGCERKQQIAASENELYWMFDKLKRIYSYGTELQDLGLVYGCSSLINKRYPSKGLAHYDYIEDEVLFKLSDCVLLFDPVVKAFVSRLSYVPSVYVLRPDYNYLSSGDGSKFYTHNHPLYKGAFYSGGYETCSLTTVENQSFDITKVYDTLNWSTSNFTNGQYANYGDQFDSTFNKLEISNDYQYSGELNISPQRRQRDFTLAIPRDISSISEVDSTTNTNYPKFEGSTLKFKRRFRDRYLKLKFTKDDTAMGHSQYFKIHYIDVNYRKSIR